MATYLIDFELCLYQSEEIEAASPEEARARGEELLEGESFWSHLLERYDDPMKTDWLRENVTVSVYGEAG